MKAACRPILLSIQYNDITALKVIFVTVHNTVYLIDILVKNYNVDMYL